MFWLFSTKPRKTVYANCGECKVHLFTRRAVRFIAVFMFGALITQIFTHTIKLMTGYQRPYFLSLCNVNMSMCTAPLEHSPSFSVCVQHRSSTLHRLHQPWRVITVTLMICGTRGCRSPRYMPQRYAWLSFPSLHAAFSSYSSIFISCYIYYMINMRGAPLLRPLLIFGFLGLALVDSFSRINGYKNHWRDIWVGWLIGFFIAIFLCHSVMWFQDVYHIAVDKVPLLEQRVSPFFSWFRLPRVHAPSIKEEYV
ncbi:unnamed protein product [Toxocara canis]|uniref:AcidPPc domain-containing protein n=1 Tax=Toxocara canis TaxID=6265 RepID=A0A183V7Z6_TOXCA|nr:unnamed protein product [Toxocara canis]